MTVNSVTNYTPPAGFSQEPAAGKHYILVNVSYHALAGHPPYNPLYFKARQADGTEDTGMHLVDVPNQMQSGDLSAGGRVRGNIVFEVPIGSHGTIIHQGTLGGDLASWTF